MSANPSLLSAFANVRDSISGFGNAAVPKNLDLQNKSCLSGTLEKCRIYEICQGSDLVQHLKDAVSFFDVRESVPASHLCGAVLVLTHADEDFTSTGICERRNRIAQFGWLDFLRLKVVKMIFFNGKDDVALSGFDWYTHLTTSVLSATQYSTDVAGDSISDDRSAQL